MLNDIKNILGDKLTEKVTQNLLKSFTLFYLAAVGTTLGIVFWLNETKDKESQNLINIEHTEKKAAEDIFVEIAGAVNKPGIYVLEAGGRLAELIKKAGGYSYEADEEWISKHINISSSLEDAQKVYIPFKWDEARSALEEAGSTAVLVNTYPQVKEEKAENTDESYNLININTASQEDVDSLKGIGPVYAAKIIENRPYDDINSLIENSGVPQGVLEKIKDKITF